MSDSVRPHRRQPTRFPCPWDSPGKNTGVACHFLLQCMNVKSESEVAQSCPTLSNPMDYSPPGSSVHGICQARVLEWVAIAFSSQMQWSSKKILSKYVPTTKPCNSNFNQISTEWGPKDVFPELWSGATKGRHLQIRKKVLRLRVSGMCPAALNQPSRLILCPERPWLPVCGARGSLRAR